MVGGSKGKILGLGNMTCDDDLSLENAMLVQSLKYYLISARQLAFAGYDTLFGLKSVKVFRSRKVWLLSGVSTPLI